MSAAVIQTTTPTEINFLADDQNKAFSVEVNPDGKIDLIGIVAGITGKSRRVSSKTLANVQINHPQLSEKIKLSKFAGSRKKTWGGNVDTGMKIVKLKVSKMDTFNFSSNGCTLHPFTQNTIKLSY